jgi:glycosyltransferase involved in cell wall biosynthesis
MESPVVHILLATYNGEQFIRQQLDSLFAQTFNNFILLVRDDGSTDNTVQIVAEYIEKFPEKIVLIKDEKKNVGATLNFGLLLEKADADYIFFCDQDDIWMKDKMEKELEALRALEKNNPGMPCVVFSDMKVIDEQDNITADSLWKELNLHPRFFSLNRLLIQNIPHGCTMAINKQMHQLATPLPLEAMLHDHWIALIAAACGKWTYLPEATLLLRNHAQNVTRKKTSITWKLQRFSSNFVSMATYEYFIRIRAEQAKALLQRCAACLNKKQKEMLIDFISLENTRGIVRKRIFLRHKFYRTTFWHTFKLILRA